MSHNHYKPQRCTAWKPNARVFKYGVRDVSIVRAYSTKIYEHTVDLLSREHKQELFKNCANVAKIQGNIAIKKMIASAKENK